MRFLVHLWQRFTGISEPSARAEAQVAGIDELLARFLRGTNHFARTKGRVKTAAFLPAPDGTVSVFAITGLGDDVIWEIGDQVVGAPTSVTIRARADLAARIVHKPLTVVRDDDPPRHRSISNWPAEKSEQQLLALELANAARLVVRSSPLGY